MQDDNLNFIAEISWPVVALIGIIILGPGGVLKGIIGDLADKLFKITDAVKSFKQTADSFHQTQIDLRESTKWVNDLQDQLQNISSEIKEIGSTTDRLAIIEGSRSIVQSAGLDISDSKEEFSISPMSAEEMFETARNRWIALIEVMRSRIPQDQFDARSIGQMAFLLTDGRRVRAMGGPKISSGEAENIQQLHSQWKRFSRLQSSKSEWLTSDVFAAFNAGIDKAMAALAN